MISKPVVTGCGATGASAAGAAAGVVAPETKFAASEQDALTGLLDRKSFITRARERLPMPGRHELVVADLDRLRRLNEALGHERADLVLAALGSRLSAAFPKGSLLARVGEDEFAVLADAGPTPAAEVLRHALEQPLRTLCDNAGVEGSVVLDKVKNGKGAFGFNAATEEFEDLLKAGIIDPTKVVRTALQNASSVAGLLLTTEAMVAEKPEEKQAPAAAPSYDDM